MTYCCTACIDKATGETTDWDRCSVRPAGFNLLLTSTANTACARYQPVSFWLCLRNRNSLLWVLLFFIFWSSHRTVNIDIINECRSTISFLLFSEITKIRKAHFESIFENCNSLLNYISLWSKVLIRLWHLFFFRSIYLVQFVFPFIC